jgi:anthranilate synthase component I
MTPEQFQLLADQGYNRIPVSREVLADLDTPLSTYLKLANGPYSYLLESVHGGEKWGRYSIIGLPCSTVLRISGNDLTLLRQGEVVESLTSEDPLAWIEAFQGRYRAPDLPYLPRFTGGLVGYFGYDTVRYIEPRLSGLDRSDLIDCPDILLMVSEEVLVFDNLTGKLLLIVHVDPAQENALQHGQRRLDELAGKLRTAVFEYGKEDVTPHRAVQEADFISGFTQDGFETAVDRIKDYIL